MEFQNMESGLLPMKRGRLIKTLADSTIKSVIDAIIELVTNSDDSYSRAEQEGKDLSGRIDIYVVRGKGGHCKEISVVDEGTGMDYQILKKAIEISGETSGFKEGRSVRGFFGRGLKESIIALGKGTIITSQDRTVNRAEIYYDNTERDAKYNLAVPIANLTSEQLLDLGLIGNAGTIVKIEITNTKKDYISGRTAIGEQLTNHFALRDINLSSRRAVFLHFSDIDSEDKFSLSSPLKYVSPIGKVVFDEQVNLNDDTLYFRIFESPEQLESPKQSHGRAGLLIKTEGAILDNQLFGFETDPVGLYFFGEIICPGIAKAIRNGDESLVDFNRGGLDWKHTYNRELEKIAKDILAKLIREKREKLNTERQIQVSAPVEKMLEKLCKKMSDLAKDELEDSEPGPGEINSFMIRPLFANIEPDVPRSLSVYAPAYLADDQGTKIVKLNTSNANIRLIQNAVTLDFHKKYQGVLKADFKVIGTLEEEMASITASLGSLYASAEVRVAPLKKGKKKKKLAKGGGLFRKITPALDENPIQRFEYIEGGVMKIYVKFPGISSYLGENFEKIVDPEARMMLAEILIEAFCRYISIRRAGKYFPEEIDRLVPEMDRLRRNSSKAIYEIVFQPEFREILG